MMSRYIGDQARPFDSQAQRFELGRLDIGVLVSSVTEILSESGRVGCEAAVAALMHHADGHPQRSMLLAHLLWQRVVPGEAPADELGDVVLADSLAAVSAEIVAMLDVLPTAEKKALRAIAEYGTPLSSRALSDHNLLKTSAQSASASLTDRALVERGPDGWRIIDPLASLWLRARYPTRPA
jgi:hypothetical protein